MTTLEKNNFTPKNYTITITNINDITNSIKIYNLKSSLLENNKLHIIINDIINNNQSSIIKENKITYESKCLHLPQKFHLLYSSHDLRPYIPQHFLQHQELPKVW